MDMHWSFSLISACICTFPFLMLTYADADRGTRVYFNCHALITTEESIVSPSAVQFFCSLFLFFPLSVSLSLSLLDGCRVIKANQSPPLPVGTLFCPDWPHIQTQEFSGEGSARPAAQICRMHACSTPSLG